MHALVVRGDRLDIRGYEIADVGRIADELQPSTLTLLRDGKRLLGSILDDCKCVDPTEWIAGDAPAAGWSSYLPFERAIDASMANLGSHQVVEEITFIAQLELRQREERLERIRPNQGIVPLLTECDSSLRRIRKALTAVDAAIAKVEAVAPLLDYASELQTSLAVRRAYAKFRARVMAGGEPTLDTLRVRFRGVGTQIAKLVGWEIYRDLRVQDRLLLRDLQQRMLDWLRGGDAAEPAAGMRLWQDLAGSLAMFILVNRRQELVEHDVRVLRDLTEQLKSRALDEDSWLSVRSLEGLDPELDQLLACTPIDVSSLPQVVHRLAVQLGATPTEAAEVAW